MRIAIDAMGGDYAPFEIVKGAVDGAREYGVALQLVGDEAQIKAELSKYNTEGLDIQITHTDEVIEMGESPAKALRAKKKASIVLTVESVAKNESQALVAAGSTGAAMASSLFGLGRLKGIHRPAICCAFPALKGPVVLIDAGANSDSEPKNLLQSAIMGRTFAKEILKYENPKVGLMNIGEEEGKGNELAKQTFELLNARKEQLNFIGNIEGRDVFKGDCHVIVCDGFVGNVVLKVAEGTISIMMSLLKQEYMASPFGKILGLLSKPIFKNIKKKMAHEEHGGALLLGVKGITVIAHGCSNALAIKNAIRVAKNAVDADVNGKIITSLD